MRRRDFIISSAIAAALALAPHKASALTLSTIGTSGRNFSTIEAWWAAQPATLTDNIEGDCFNDTEFSPSGGGLSFTGVTAGSFTVKLTCGSGQSFRDNAGVQTNALRYNQANGVGISLNNFASIQWIVNCSNVTLDGLQIKSIASSGNELVFQGATGSPANFTLSNSILDFSGNAGVASVLRSASSNGVTFFNLVIYGSSIGAGINGDYTSGSTFTYLTVMVPGLGGTLFGIGPSNYSANLGIAMRDCLVLGYATPSNNSGKFSASSGNNATDQASGLPGSSNLFSLTASSQIVATGSPPDARAKAGAGIITAGVVVPSVTTVDIAKTTRPQGSAPTIGAWEFISSSPTTVPYQFGVL